MSYESVVISVEIAKGVSSRYSTSTFVTETVDVVLFTLSVNENVGEVTSFLGTILSD